MIKASQLIAWIKQHVGDGYVYGTVGQICTVDLLKQCQSQYGAQMGDGYYCKGGDYTKGRCARWLGKWVCDCSGLIKAARKAVSGVWQDVSAQGTYDQCDTRGAIDSMPLIPGYAVFMYSPAKKRMGHVGVYAGNGQVVEARGADYGVVVTRLADRAWTHWGRLKWLEYDLGADRGKASAGKEADAGDATNQKPDDAAPDAIDVTINNALIDGAITVSEYWEKVLRGDTACNPEWLKTLLDNYHNAAGR